MGFGREGSSADEQQGAGMAIREAVTLADATKREVRAAVIELRAALEEDQRRQLRRLGLDAERGRRCRWRSWRT